MQDVDIFTFCRALFYVLMLAVLMLVFCFKHAHARDLDGRYAQSPNKEWFQGLRSAKGPCCSDADGNTVEPTDWETQDKPNSHYRVRIEGQWFDVPDDAVLKEPNRVGRAIVWPIYMHAIGGALDIQIRCFLPGTFG